MKRVELSPERMGELEWAARRHLDARVRSRLLAVRAVALGHTRQEVAAMLPYSGYSIGAWVRQFQTEGVAGLAIAAGRGRHSRVDATEVRACLRVSPERYGWAQSRWTLHALGQVCPSLRGMSQQGILNVLHRLGFRYKRGQPWLHSPDPRYAEKKPPSRPPMPKPVKTRRR